MSERCQCFAQRRLSCQVRYGSYRIGIDRLVDTACNFPYGHRAAMQGETGNPATVLNKTYRAECHLRYAYGLYLGIVKPAHSCRMRDIG
jgi:hypothetical protein